MTRSTSPASRPGPLPGPGDEPTEDPDDWADDTDVTQGRAGDTDVTQGRAGDTDVTGVSPQAWRNRIVGEGYETPDQLLANPLNWRVHPLHQQQKLEGVLSEVGWIQRIIVNEATGHVIDGHARVGLAIARGEPRVPVLYVDLTLEEERLVLATLDPIGALAGTDREILDTLLAEVSSTNGAVQSLLDDLTHDRGTLAIPDDGTDGLGAGDSRAGDGDGKHGDWELVRIQLPPEIAEDYRKALATMPGREDWERFGALVRAVEGRSR